MLVIFLGVFLGVFFFFFENKSFECLFTHFFSFLFFSRFLCTTFVNLLPPLKPSPLPIALLLLVLVRLEGVVGLRLCVNNQKHSHG